MHVSAKAATLFFFVHVSAKAAQNFILPELTLLVCMLLPKTPFCQVEPGGMHTCSNLCQLTKTAANSGGATTG